MKKADPFKVDRPSGLCNSLQRKDCKLFFLESDVGFTFELQHLPRFVGRCNLKIHGLQDSHNALHLIDVAAGQFARAIP